MIEEKTMNDSDIYRKKVLLHICCAPCSIYVLKTLHEDGADVQGYFFNPNIHPYTEFKKRLSDTGRLLEQESLPLEIDPNYDSYIS
jgi:predicted adenine nucleotide alpha hydrolase (AANH) superfamily ATPase